jgi:hypothetical protein
MRERSAAALPLRADNKNEHEVPPLPPASRILIPTPCGRKQPVAFGRNLSPWKV